jgi:hypothetical protein
MVTWAQRPGRLVDFRELRRLAATSGDGHHEVDTRRQSGRVSALLAAVRDDAYYHRGTGDLAHLIQSLDDENARYYRAVAEEKEAQLASCDATTPKAGSLHQQRASVAGRRKEVHSVQIANFRSGLSNAAQLSAYLEFEHRLRRATWALSVISPLVALLLVLFVWAANPPDESPPTEAAPSAPPVTRLHHI